MWRMEEETERERERDRVRGRERKERKPTGSKLSGSCVLKDLEAG